jgi:hypothetical protein
VRLVCVPLCVRVSRVSRVCPGSPRCLFTGTVFQKELDTPGESSLEAGKFSGSLACANEAPGAWHVYTARPSERPHAMAGGLDDA